MEKRFRNKIIIIIIITCGRVETRIFSIKKPGVIRTGFEPRV